MGNAKKSKTPLHKNTLFVTAVASAMIGSFGVIMASIFSNWGEIFKSEPTAPKSEIGKAHPKADGILRFYHEPDIEPLIPDLGDNPLARGYVRFLKQFGKKHSRESLLEYKKLICSQKSVKYPECTAKFDHEVIEPINGSIAEYMPEIMLRDYQKWLRSDPNQFWSNLDRWQRFKELRQQQEQHNSNVQ